MRAVKIPVLLALLVVPSSCGGVVGSVKMLPASAIHQLVLPATLSGSSFALTRELQSRPPPSAPRPPPPPSTSSPESPAGAVWLLASHNARHEHLPYDCWLVTTRAINICLETATACWRFLCLDQEPVPWPASATRATGQTRSLIAVLARCLWTTLTTLGS